MAEFVREKESRAATTRLTAKRCGMRLVCSANATSPLKRGGDPTRALSADQVCAELKKSRACRRYREVLRPRIAGFIAKCSPPAARPIVKSSRSSASSTAAKTARPRGRATLSEWAAVVAKHTSQFYIKEFSAFATEPLLIFRHDVSISRASTPIYQRLHWD